MSNRLSFLLVVFTMGTLLVAGSALACDGGASAAAAEDTPTTTPTTPAPKAPQATVEFTTLQVDGVSSGSCIVPIRRELKALTGVKEIEQGADAKEIIVSYAAGSVSTKQLVDAIKKAGYDAVVKGAAPPAKS